MGPINNEVGGICKRSGELEWVFRIDYSPRQTETWFLNIGYFGFHCTYPQKCSQSGPMIPIFTGLVDSNLLMSITTIF